MRFKLDFAIDQPFGNIGIKVKVECALADLATERRKTVTAKLCQVKLFTVNGQLAARF